MCCSFSVIQGAHVEIPTDASNFTPKWAKYNQADPVKMKAICYSETLVMIYQTIGHHISITKQVGSSGNVPDIFAGYQFESCPTHRLS
jgi:hypothetical protein